MQQQWFVGVDGTPRGPYERQAVTAMFADGTFDADALVWREGMAAWASSAEAGLAPVVPPPMPPSLPPALPSSWPERSGLDWPPVHGGIVAIRGERPPVVAVDDDGWQDLGPAPWSRYFGRCIDTMLIGIALWMFIGVVLEANDPPLFHRFTGVGGLFRNPLASSVMSFMIVIPLQALLLGLSGSTPGKWIFGVRITRPDGRPIGIGWALQREFTVFLKGVGLGIPIFVVIAQIIGYRTLVHDRRASWDADRPWVVTYRPQGAMHTALFVLGLLIWAAGIIYIRMLSQ